MQKLTNDLLDEVIDAVQEESINHADTPDDLIHAELEFLLELQELRRKKAKKQR